MCKAKLGQSVFLWQHSPVNGQHVVHTLSSLLYHNGCTWLYSVHGHNVKTQRNLIWGITDVFQIVAQLSFWWKSLWKLYWLWWQNAAKEYVCDSTVHLGKNSSRSDAASFHFHPNGGRQMSVNFLFSKHDSHDLHIFAADSCQTVAPKFVLSKPNLFRWLQLFHWCKTVKLV